VVSQSTLDDFKHRGYDTTNFSIIYNALNESNFPFAITNKDIVPSITYFGRLKKYKSVDHLFYAFANVVKKYPTAMLKIIGKGDFRETLERLANRLGISKNVVFLGFVTEEVKAKELASSYIVVNTSLKEGWGITNIEANACGTPVISANVPGLRDSVKDGQSGLLYEYGSIDELTNCILKILDNESLRLQLSAGAIEWAKSFSWNIAAEQMLAKCENVIYDCSHSIN
jgi:glycosyltransferase involved in cell wall biosynthesis